MKPVEIIMKKQDKKENDYFWVCNFCNQKFDTKIELNKHELACSKNPTSKIYRIFIYYLYKVGFWPLIVIGIIFVCIQDYRNSIYTYENWVYACPNLYTSKCYKVKADINSGDCEEIEIDIRGNSGGDCTDPYVEKIYFDNNRYITFEYCDLEKKDKWICYPENSKNGEWKIELSETKRVKR